MSKILVIDDEPSIVDLIEVYLRDEGYQTSHAYSGEEAMAAMINDRPDLMLLDLHMPEMGGAEVCHEMQQDPRLMDIPIIVLTASTSARERKLAWQAGANDYVTKPFDLDELAQHIHAQLHYHEHQRISELTGLPAGPAIVEAIRRCINSLAQGLVITYINIEHLDAYNETYSFLEGNELIQKTATILREAVAKSGGEGDFLGHIGGGEFVIIAPASPAQQIADQATARFNQEVPAQFYPAAVCKQGYVMASNHDSQLYHCPLVELSFDREEIERKT